MFAGSIDAIAGTAANAATRSAVGYGPLVTDPAGILSLPKGFSYKIVAEAGKTVMDGGALTPTDMDGMAAFASPAGTTLVYNHEISGSEKPPVPHVDGLVYDPKANGGTTNLELDRNNERVREYVSVAGTENNCAGGVTPWGTWLTCEETEKRAGTSRDKDHGYVFEVSPVESENPNNSNVPLKFLGRFAHEAVVVDPDTHVMYETEDASNRNGLFYRWVPPSGFEGGKGSLVALARSADGDTAGQLQAMRCARGSRHIADLSEATQPGTRYKVTWIDVPDRDARTTSVRHQLTDSEVTRSRKLEGAWWGDGGAYFVASYARLSDGSRNEHDGQVWFYDPASETVTLKTIFGVNPDPDVDADNYDGPDNITVSPYGGVILAEDGDGVQHLVGVTEEGKSYTLARNDQGGSEFTGPVFSPDGKTLYASIQSGPGRVFAITGPWGRASNAR
ncbi:MAG TPA: alkaline phosphatase PhoX [Actinomycetales bacterium]|nr:alkaline phosphatase PhoX [Actinomycetales bacterium]